jgi:uncharacterized protein
MSKKRAYKTASIEELSIRSHFVEQSFRMRVHLPIRCADDSERFPVLYATDSDEFFGGLATMVSELQLVGEIPRFVTVAIGYETARDADLLRMRDLFTRDVRESAFRSTVAKLAAGPLSSGDRSVESILQSTDAVEFLQFIRDELIPSIDKTYPTDAKNRSYCGFSAGGTFGLYTLFNRPETFSRYLLGSPATSFDGRHFGIELAKSFINSGRPMKAAVFMSAGELEEFYGKFDLVSGYYLMAKYLREAAIPGLELETRLFPDETHATSWAPAFGHGLKALLGPGEATPWWPKF